MGVVIETEIWELKPIAYVFLFLACFASIALRPYFSSSSSKSTGGGTAVFDLGPTALFSRFQKSFLLLYSLASVMEGLQSVFGEYAFAQYAMSKEQMSMCLAVGAVAALVLGTFSGILSDTMGPRNACFLFCILHLLVGVLKNLTRHPSLLIASICLSISSSLFSFCFETWMVLEHEKLGHKQDLLGETFWLMTFYESVSFISSQGLANSVVKDLGNGIFSPSALAAILAIISILYIRKAWRGSNHMSMSIIGSYRKSFSAHVLKDKRIWVLALAQTSIHFSMSTFWILWAPSIVADGREVQLSKIYPLFMGSRMLGCTAFPWFTNGVSSLQFEDCLTSALGVAGLALLIVAYDYQEIGILVFLFCIFHACVGLSLPSLAKLRTIYLPNELRGGMISFSLAPANAAIALVVIQAAYYRKPENSTIMGFAAFSLLIAAGCIYLLRFWRKQGRQSSRHL